MARKCKFDAEWEMALALLSCEEAAQVRRLIEDYQQTGHMPTGLKPVYEMILLLAKPLIDRRRRAAESARMRRQQKKAATTNTPGAKHPDTNAAKNNHTPLKKNADIKQSKNSVNKLTFSESIKRLRKKHRHNKKPHAKR